MNKLNRDEVAASIKRSENDRWRNDPSFEWLHIAAEKIDGIAEHARIVAAESGDAHGAAVADSVVKNLQRRNPRVTMKQRYVIARILTERYGSARALAAVIYGLTDKEIDNAVDD
uniref:hypothetical protein n=1 Tax=Xanthomonas albilineans TaxID=29447 RepID=UPI0027DD1EC8|nr:hypothetical protein [Xanthomonas albilineans]